MNLSDGLAGTLVDKIYVHKAREEQQGGTNLLEQIRKRKAMPRNICGQMINASQQDCLQKQGNFNYLKISVAMLEIGYMKRRTVSMKSSCRKKNI